MSLQKGERIISESDAMVMMEDALDLRSQLTGGSVSSLARRLTTGETLSQQSIEAVRGNGDCLLAPNLPGSIEVLQVSGVKEYNLADGGFMAAGPQSFSRVGSKVSDRRCWRHGRVHYS